MAEIRDVFGVVDDFSFGDGKGGRFYSLPRLQGKGVGPISRLPVSLRIVLESVLRNEDGEGITSDDVHRLAGWKPNAERTAEIPFVVARILLQDFTGVPLLVDLAAMRSAARRMGKDPGIINPTVPVDLVVDHSVQVDYAGIADALQRNMRREFERNAPRYEFLKWGTQAFDGFNVVPPGVGIVHQVNLEYLAQGVLSKDGVYYPDTLVGTDSHTTMINGLGVVGWGVGGIEAEAGMLGQPLHILMPDVVGVHLSGALRPGVTATDLVLHITEMLRRAKVVGKFVEYHGPGAASLSLTDRATLGNMAPEYGATIGFFPVDEESCRYLAATGRTREQVDAFRAYFQAQGMFGMPEAGQVDYTQVIELNLDDVRPSVAGPKRPQDRIDLTEMKERFVELLTDPDEYNKTPEEASRRYVVLTGVSQRPGGEATLVSGGGDQNPASVPDSEEECVSENDTNALTEVEMMQNRPTPNLVEASPEEFPKDVMDLGNGDVVIAAITSCTNTSNPSVILAAGLLAKKAVELGLSPKEHVKTSLAPGSRVVTEYLTRTGLQEYLDRLGFQTVGYGCTTCIGNSGPLDPHIEQAVTSNGLVVASVLSGNRNFEARIHQNVRANFLMSPPLVVAFALAGRVDIDLDREPLGQSEDGRDVFLRDIWPAPEEVAALLETANDPESYQRLYSGLSDVNPMWSETPIPTGQVYDWDDTSTYIQEPPLFERFSMEPAGVKDIRGARSLAIFGDSVTTDHISPAGAIKPDSPAGLYLQERGVRAADFNTYGARRGNDRVMVRGTFANIRIRNRMVPGVEGGFTLHQPDGERVSIYEAAMWYQADRVPLMVFAGHEYGTGSSRDWAAKGTLLLGVRAVVARSFERIHRSNLVGMGVLPVQFREEHSAESLGLVGDETFDIVGLENGLSPRMEATLIIRRADGTEQRAPVMVRIDTPIEVEYYRHGGILRYVLRRLIGDN